MVQAMVDTAKVRAEKVMGVNLQKIDLPGMLKVLVEAKLIAKGEPLTAPEAVKMLTQHFKTKPGIELADCDNCQGVSDVRLDACPFCGVGGLVDVTIPAAKQEAKQEPKAEPKPEAKSQQLVKVVKASLVAAATIAELEAGVAEVARLKGSSAVSMWDLGREIAKLYDRQSYKLRVDEKGKPVYAHWNQFCTAELQMTPGNAMNLIDTAKVFKREEVQKFGTTKLGLVLQAPKEEHQKILEAHGDKPVRVLKQVVQERKKETGHVRDTGRGGMKGGGGTKGREPKVKPEPKGQKEKITVAAILRTHTVPLFAKPDRGEEPKKRAKRFGDQPVGVLELENAVRMYFTLYETPSGEWAIKVNVKRVAE